MKSMPLILVEKNTELSYKTVEELYVSPAVKRQIWQTLKIVKEIKKVMGADPQRVFVEMAREKQESKRTESRKNNCRIYIKHVEKKNLNGLMNFVDNWTNYRNIN